MSMIGTTLIKDICLRDGYYKSLHRYLTTLDNEVREALESECGDQWIQRWHGYHCGGSGHEGLLGSLVSSAMRPVIIYSGGEQIYVKGSRCSIGGQLDDDRTEKDFIDQEFKSEPGRYYLYVF